MISEFMFHYLLQFHENTILLRDSLSLSRQLFAVAATLKSRGVKWSLHCKSGRT